jgi:periplasmic protein TonB
MSADTHNNALSNMDEIVFEHRNKAYGAYDLRNAYQGVLTKSFLIGTAVFLVSIIAPIVYSEIKKANAVENTDVVADVKLIQQEDEIIEQPKETPPPPPPPKVEPPKIETVKDMLPEPAQKPKNEEPPKKLSEVKDTTIGTKTEEGVKVVNAAPPPPPPSNGIQKGVELPKTDPATVYTEVDQEAEFDGGLNGFRGKISQNFDTSSFEGTTDEIKANISFIVERDGTLTDVKATGDNSEFNRECERTIKNLRMKCKPAKFNGENVRSRFKMPMKMQFE